MYNRYTRSLARVVTGAVTGALLAIVVAAAPADAQRHTTRFFVDSVADSTFVFRVGAVRWIERGQTGIAVDPSKRDALVARFRVLDVSHERVTALITGQTTFLTGEHVAIIEEPARSFWRRGLFWTGSVIGLALGVAAGLAF